MSSASTDPSLGAHNAPALQPGAKRALLVWDAPNMDMGLGSVLGARPTSAQRPRFDALGRWLLKYADTLGADTSAEATVFANISPDATESVRPWVEALRNVGFAVFAKPKTADDSDVDEDMLHHINIREHNGQLAGLVVASADGQAFNEPLKKVVAAGIPVTVIGFREHAQWALNDADFTFIDVEDIAGMFREPLPRMNLESLPEQGAWLQPLRPLAALLNSGD